MTEVVPRWEWRSFGDDLEEAGRRLAAATRGRVGERDEVYVLSRNAWPSVKLREGVLDVKVLEDVGLDGIERWRPTLKLSEPFSAADVAELLRLLGVEDLPARPEYTFAQLLDEVVGPSPELLAVPVHKRREHFTVGGCMAELSTFRTAHGSARTIAVESEDPALVTATVRELGLASRRNVSVPRGLATLAGFGARRFAVLDVGTNSLKFHVAERAADGSWRTLADGAEVTRLGEGLDETGVLGDEPMRRTADAIAAVVEQARGDGVEEIAAVGTAGLRMAENSAAFVEGVRERTGVEIEVISGEEEARLAFAAVTAGLDVGSGVVVVFDTGGGSSQFTFAADGDIEEQFSLNVGAARITERFGLDGAVSEQTLAEAMDAVAGDLAQLDDRPVPEAIVGLGGANTNLAAVKLGLETYDPDAVQGTVLDVTEIERQLELYRACSAEERRSIAGLQPKRAEVILGGACIVRTVLELLGAQSLTVSDRGLRHGLLAERFGL